MTSRPTARRHGGPHRTSRRVRRLAVGITVLTLAVTALSSGWVVRRESSAAAAVAPQAVVGRPGVVNPALRGASAAAAKPGAWATTVSPYVLDDEFNGPAGVLPDSRTWTFETGGGGWGNNELESYTKRAVNASTDGQGHLAITARKETYTGADGITRWYTSARIKSRASVQYGLIEARIKVPAGAGLWPAFWTLGADIGKVGWPKSGEIDIMEAINSADVLHGSLHGPDATQPSWAAFSRTNSIPVKGGLAAAWHTFGIRWSATAITWYLDGHAYYTVTKAELPAVYTWEFAKPHQILLNLAVGGNWPGWPSATTVFPARMLVDWVRASH
jgi:beta-glucanase (GH16 family)